MHAGLRLRKVVFPPVRSGGATSLERRHLSFSSRLVSFYYYCVLCAALEEINVQDTHGEARLCWDGHFCISKKIPINGINSKTLDGRPLRKVRKE